MNPLFFINGLCPKCGELAVEFKDQYGHTTKNPIYTAVGMICRNCGTEYPIEWIDINKKKIPSPSTKEDKVELEKDIMKFAVESVRDISMKN